VRTSTARLPVQIRPIEDWAEARSVENVQQFSSFANLYREVTGIVAVNEELGCARKRQERLQFLGFAGKRQEHSAVLELRKLLLPPC
jgi:hypothetical protein